MHIKFVWKMMSFVATEINLHVLFQVIIDYSENLMYHGGGGGLVIWLVT
jgi:hypothetical protein